MRQVMRCSSFGGKVFGQRQHITHRSGEALQKLCCRLALTAWPLHLRDAQHALRASHPQTTGITAQQLARNSLQSSLTLPLQVQGLRLPKLDDLTPQLRRHTRKGVKRANALCQGLRSLCPVRRCFRFFNLVRISDAFRCLRLRLEAAHLRQSLHDQASAQIGQWAKFHSTACRPCPSPRPSA